MLQLTSMRRNNKTFYKIPIILYHKQSRMSRIFIKIFAKGEIFMISKSDWSYERARLEGICKKILAEIEEKEKTLGSYKEDIVDLRKTMWEDTPHIIRDSDDKFRIQQYIDEIKIQEHRHTFYFNQLRKLKRILDKPYFARIDFMEQYYEEPEKIYIGIASMFDKESSDILIYDWRAPISSIYYDYELGTAEYYCKEGTIKGDLSLKRQFSIKYSEIQYMLDSSIKIDDEVLQQILSKNTDDKMRNIVTSIQKEQNKIIRDEKHDLLIVQGAAGSGKTSIALHRVAYLLYKYRYKNINSKNIVIFSPNEVFNDYISNVLPELGEENMQQTTFYDYARRSISLEYKVEDMNDQMEYLLVNTDDLDYKHRVEFIKYKLSKDFISVLNNYIKYLEEERFKFDNIEYRGKIIFSKREIEELFYINYKHFPIMKRLNKIRERIFYYLRPLQKDRLQEIEKEMKFKVDFEHEIKPFSRLERYKEFKPTIDKINDMTSLDLYKVYSKLFEEVETHRKMLEGISLPENFERIKELTIKDIEDKKISYEDVAPILYLKGELEGVSFLSDINHVVLDEGQDYSAIQYEVFKQLFKGCGITILGDLNQSIHPFTNTEDYDFIVKTFNYPESVKLRLRKSYRSTKEIVEFSKTILNDGEAIESINRSGEKPVVKRVADGKDTIKRILEDIKSLKIKKANSIAIICKTSKESYDVHNQLKNEIDVNLITKDDIKFKRGICVIPSYLAKGLEFDAVLIFDASKETYSKKAERKLFYTACTRALHNLYIYHQNDLSPFIAGINKELYLE